MQADRSHVSILPHIDRLGLDPEQIVELGRHVEDMTRSEGWKIITDLIDSEIQHQRNLLEWPTQPLEQAQYSGLTGRIRGLSQLRGAVEAVQIAAGRAVEQQRQIVAKLTQENA